MDYMTSQNRFSADRACPYHSLLNRSVLHHSFAALYVLEAPLESSNNVTQNRLCRPNADFSVGCFQLSILIPCSNPVHVRDATTNGLRQANLVLITYASSEGSGEPAHPRSLARTSAARSYKQ